MFGCDVGFIPCAFPIPAGFAVFPFGSHVHNNLLRVILIGVQEGWSSFLFFSGGTGAFVDSFGMGVGGGCFLKWLIVLVSVSTFACSAITWLSGSLDFH